MENNNDNFDGDSNMQINGFTYGGNIFSSSKIDPNNSYEITNITGNYSDSDNAFSEEQIYSTKNDNPIDNTENNETLPLNQNTIKYKTLLEIINNFSQTNIRIFTLAIFNEDGSTTYLNGLSYKMAIDKIAEIHKNSNNRAALMVWLD